MKTHLFYRKAARLLRRRQKQIFVALIRQSTEPRLLRTPVEAAGIVVIVFASAVTAFGDRPPLETFNTDFTEMNLKSGEEPTPISASSPLHDVLQTLRGQPFSLRDR